MAKRGNGEGSIYYNKLKNIWVGQFTTYDNQGKMKRHSIYGKTRKEVSTKLNENLNTILTKTYVEKNSINLHNVVKDLIEMQYHANLVRTNTYLRNKDTLKIIDKFPIAYLKIQDITPQQINSNLLTLIDTCSNSTIEKVYNLLKRAYNKAELEKLITRSPFTTQGLILKPKSKLKTKVVSALTIDEQKLLLNELNNTTNKHKYVFLTALYTGMRIGEILALEINDIDFKNNLIHISKTLTKNEDQKTIIGDTTKTYAGTREIPLPQILVPIFKELCSKTFRYLFTDNNKLIGTSTINSAFKIVCKNAKIRVDVYKLNRQGKTINLQTSNVNTHMLRHTYATRCIESGMSPVVLQRLLGHKDIETTLNTYTSVFNKFKEDEISKLNNYLSAINCG